MRAHLIVSQCLAKFKPVPTDDPIVSKTRENVALIAVGFGSCHYIGILLSPPMLPWDECVRGHCYVIIEFAFLGFCLLVLGWFFCSL